MSYDNQSPNVSDLAEEIGAFEKSPAARPQLRARVGAWAYSILVVSLMIGTMMAWVILIGWFINRFS